MRGASKVGTNMVACLYWLLVARVGSYHLWVPSIEQVDVVVERHYSGLDDDLLTILVPSWNLFLTVPGPHCIPQDLLLLVTTDTWNRSVYICAIYHTYT